MAAAGQRPLVVAAALFVVVSMLLASTSVVSSQSMAPAAAAPGPAGGMDSACMNSLLNMSDCLTYVEQGSRARRPEKPCCPELAGLVDSNRPVCLCELLSGAADSYGIAVDYARALALPGICHARLHLHSTWVSCASGPSCSANGRGSLAHVRPLSGQ